MEYGIKYRREYALDMGSGYIDMGLDNFFEFDENGDMLADTQRAWIAIDQQYVAYYHLSTTKNGDETVTIGRVPVILNGERANLIIIFDGEHPNGYLAGANTDYKDTQTETIAKNITDIVEGDRIQFYICLLRIMTVHILMIINWMMSMWLERLLRRCLMFL